MSEDSINDESGEVWAHVPGTVVDWAHKTLINPETGEVFDFLGNRLVSE